MRQKTIAVIGGGISGLSAGIYAQLNGYDSTIYELHNALGGVAATWRRKDYLIDGGIHFLSMNNPDLRIFRLYQEVGIENVDYREMEMYARFLDIKTGRSIDVTNDLNALDATLRGMFPQDEEIVSDIIRATKSISKVDTTDIGMDKPVELMGTKDKLSELWEMRSLLKYMTGKYSQTVQNYTEPIQDPMFREFLQLMFLPEVPVWFIAMILAQLSEGQMAYLGEGSKGLIDAMEARYRGLGGRIILGAEVQRVLVEDDTAIGLQLINGEEYKTDFVIPAMDSHSLIYDLLAGRYVNETIEKRHKTWKLGRPLLMINYGVKREFKDEPYMILFKLEESLTIGNEQHDLLFIRFFNYGDVFSPPGKTVVQVELETGWDYWYDLRTTNEKEYRAEKIRAAEVVLEILEKQYPGMSDLVEVTDVSTPYTMWRYTRNREGAYMGWLPTSKLLTTRLKKTLPGLRNCYLAGQWSMGMGGVLPSLYSGRHAVQLLCKEDGLKFKTN